MNALALVLAMTLWTVTPNRVAGHYVLEGAHEVGSEPALKPNGQFEYMLAYGAADYYARGQVAGEG